MRDRPDLAEKVRAGDLSAHAAAIEAGFRSRTITLPVDDVPRLAEALRRRLTPGQLAELHASLYGDRH